jgi:hypothetical protein
MSRISSETETDILQRLRNDGNSWAQELFNEAAFEIEKLRRELAAGHAPTVQQPVAWRYRFVTSVDGDLSDWFIVDDIRSIPTRTDQTVQPLYTTSPDTSTDQKGDPNG